MSAATVQTNILDLLIRRPSRASAAAIGHNFVLNGSPPALRIRGLDALSQLICDWSVAILEEAINDLSRGYLIRRYALNCLCSLLMQAIRRGYRGVTKGGCAELQGQAVEALTQEADRDEAGRCENEPAEELCNHLDQAIADGVFEELPDF